MTQPTGDIIRDALKEERKFLTRLDWECFAPSQKPTNLMIKAREMIKNRADHIDERLTKEEDVALEPKATKITRLEVIDSLREAPRSVLVFPEENREVTYALQDEGRTLKVFIA